MRIHKEYRRLENIEEVNIYDVHEKEFSERYEKYQNRR